MLIYIFNFTNMKVNEIKENKGFIIALYYISL